VPYADFGDPQSFNLYGYVRNAPTVKLDADGHCEGDDCENITVKVAVTYRGQAERFLIFLTVDGSLSSCSCFGI